MKRAQSTAPLGRGEANPDVWAVGWLARSLVVLSLLAAVLVPLGAPIIAVPGNATAGTPGAAAPILIPLGGPAVTPTPLAVTPTPHIPRVGIIAGHSGTENDSGAICPDGLQEVQVNTDIARRVVALLQNRGWQVDLLTEFDPRLNDYQADALLSIHNDSCIWPGKSGFKVARAESSYIPLSEDRLVNCLIQRYQARTGLAFDANTITYDMTRYHAYYEINRNTPAAIIETGFLLDDRQLLTQRPDLVAQGVVEGLICFIEGESAP